MSGAQFSVHITENIILLNEKKSNASIVITVPPGAVAELYRRFFGAPAGLPLGSQIPIPEESPTGETRQQFLDSITNQQLTGLGLEVDLHESFLVPRTTGGEFEVVMRGPATFARDYSTDRAGSGFVRHVAVGFHGMNATSNAELLFETLTFGQMMLQSLQGSHVFTSTWETSIHFPSEAVLLNPDELSRLNWKVEFGPDMSSTAKVTAGKKSTVDVEETTTIGDGDITANPQVLMSELSGYKQFELVIQFPAAGTSPDGAIVPDSSQPAQEPTPMVGDDDPDLSFSKDFRNISHPKFDVPLIDASDTDPATGITSKLSATVIVDALLDLGLHLDLKASVSFLDGFQATAFSAYFSMKMNATVSFHQTLVGVGWKKDLAPSASSPSG